MHFCLRISTGDLNFAEGQLKEAREKRGGRSKIPCFVRTILCYFSNRKKERKEKNRRNNFTSIITTCKVTRSCRCGQQHLKAKSNKLDVRPCPCMQLALVSSRENRISNLDLRAKSRVKAKRKNVQL